MAVTAWEEAQRAVVGSLLIDPENVAGMIFSRARAEHFGDSALRHVFSAARELWLARRPVDPVTILHAAGDDYRALLELCMKQTPTAANVEAYLELIRSEARLHRLKAAALEIAAAPDEKSAIETWDRVGQLLQGMEDVEDLSWAECVNVYLDRMNEKAPPDYIRFGIQQLDDVLNVSAGKFVILAADSSVGKTALALQFAYRIAESGRRVGFFSLETDSESLTDRLMAEKQVGGIALPRSKHRALSDADYRSAAEVGHKSARVPLRILRRADTLEQIRSRTIMHGFEVIFIDYVQLIDAPGRERWDIVTNVSIGLHRMAQQLGVTVVGLSQITPPSKDQKRAPSKDDLRESRQLKHDADVILILSISPEGAGVFRELRVAKNKDGMLGRMLLDFDAEHMTFSYRAPAAPNPYAQIAPAAKKAAKTSYQKTPGQVELRELPPGAGGELPF